MATSNERGASQSRHRVELPATARAPGLARQETRAALADCAYGRVDDIEMVTSELVTNAITHTDSHPTLRISWDSAVVRVEVHDGAHSIPVFKDADAIGGYGLRIVASISDAWGWEQTSTGKLVWAAFNRR